MAASGSDPCITTGWLESVFNSTSSTLYSRLVDSQTTLLQASVDSWGELRNLSGAFETFAKSFDNVGYTYGTGALAGDKTKFFKGIFDEHYIVAASFATTTQVLGDPLEIDAAGYVESFSICTSSKALQHYMVQQTDTSGAQIACTPYGFLMLRSLQKHPSRGD